MGRFYWKLIGAARANIRELVTHAVIFLRPGVSNLLARPTGTGRILFVHRVEASTLSSLLPYSLHSTGRLHIMEPPPLSAESSSSAVAATTATAAVTAKKTKGGNNKHPIHHDTDTITVDPVGRTYQHFSFCDEQNTKIATYIYVFILTKFLLLCFFISNIWNGSTKEEKEGSYEYHSEQCDCHECRRDK